jgi:hypothetical protein
MVRDLGPDDPRPGRRSGVFPASRRTVRSSGAGRSATYVGTFLGAPITQQEPAAVLSGQARTVRGTGPNGLRPGARVGFPA